MAKASVAKIVYGVIVISSFAMLVSGWIMSYGADVQYLNASEVSIATVQSGSFSQKINGYGALQSINQMLITTPVAAVVEEVKLKPGAVVSSDTVLLILKNPELTVAHKRSLAQLQSANTERRKIVLEQQRELLDAESDLAGLRADMEAAQQQVKVEAPLAKAGIIPRMEAEKNKLKEEQLKTRLEFEERKLGKLKGVHEEQLQIQDEAIDQARAEVDSYLGQLEALTVKAGMEGILQRLPVSLGQRVTPGAELALVGSLSPLIAELKVPQMQAHLITPGSEAEIDTRRGIVKGQVVRIDPVVADGAVQVDVQLPVGSGADLRPMQTVDAAILVRSRDQVHFLQKPKGVVEDSQTRLFKMIGDHEAVSVAVKLGEANGSQIEVVAGLKPGDRVIVAGLDINEQTNRTERGQV